MTLLLTIMILANTLAILYLLDAVHFLLEQYDVIDVLLDMRGEKDDD